MKFRPSINFKGMYKITQSDGMDFIYLNLEELKELKEEIENALEIESQSIMKEL